jgi:hypothetical protein
MESQHPSAALSELVAVVRVVVCSGAVVMVEGAVAKGCERDEG